MSYYLSPLIISVFICLVCETSAQSPTGKDARLSIKSTKDFEVTGEGQDPAWNATEWITLTRIKGSSNYKTRVKLLYSEKGIYALFSCEDKKITATLQEDFASLFKEDVIEMFLWPDESFPIYLEYELSPLNYELAILVPNLNGHASGWTPWNYKGAKKTRKATKIYRDKNEMPTEWIGEFFIPYTLMRPLQNVPPAKGTTWRANVYRIDYDESESSYWSWQPVNNNFHEFQKYGTFVFE
jgi:hypothetical protein